MKDRFASGTLTPKQLSILIAFGAVIGFIALDLVLRALYRGQDWRLFDAAWMNYALQVLGGIVLSIAWFYREYTMYNKMTFVLEGETYRMAYEDKEDKTYFLKDLRDVRLSPLFYGWFGYLKVVFRFRDSQDKRRKTIVFLLRKDEEKAFTKALYEAREAALKKAKIKK